MRSFAPAYRLPFRLAVVPFFLLTATVFGQPQAGPGLPQPRLTVIAPNGAKAGTTVVVSVTGSDTEDPVGLIFSHPGIKAEEMPDPPPDPKQPQPQPKGKRNQMGPVITHQYKVTVAPDVPLGIHDLRLVNKFGVSNPRAFVVGDLNEVAEKEPNNDVDQAQSVELNTTVNGVINTPTDVDYYVFKGQKGQKVVVSCLASSIESRANPVVEVYQKGRDSVLVANRDYHEHDAVVDVVLPAEGEYFVRVSQFTHLTGGVDHYYRLSITTAPWIDAVVPPVVEPGKATQLTVYGRNLPGGQPDATAIVPGSAGLEKVVVPFTAPADPAAAARLAYSGYLTPPSSNLDGVDFRLKNAAGSSNAYLLTLGRNPVVLDNNTNITREAAQTVPVPCEVAGRLDRAHTQAWYAFDLKKGESYSIELIGQRMGTPLDFAFSVYTADGKPAAGEQDDDPETLSNNQFYTKSSDPARLPFKPAADGKYLVMIKSQESAKDAGPRHLYRLRVSPDQPDFRLVAMSPSPVFPETGTARQGCQEEIGVYVWRRDGFNGDIALTMEGLPPNVVCPPQTIAPGVKHAALVIKADPNAAAWTGEVKIKGTATINGQPVVREARAATIIHSGQPQNPNIPTFTRLDRGIFLAVREKGPFNVALGAPDKPAVTQGDKITIPVTIERFWPDAKNPVNVVAVGLPTGVQFNNNNQPMAVAGDKGSLVLTVAPNAPPGTFTIVFRGTTQFPYAKDPMAKQKPNHSVNLPSLPVTISIVPKQLAAVALTPPNAQAKPGATVEVVVKLTRMYDYAGEFKVALVQPPNAKGIEAPEVTIPAGKDEAKLVLTIAGDAAVGNRGDLLVRATTKYNNVDIVQEAKFAVNIVK
jgi:hypothetical protein